jgi:uncharacterized iron-regulated membrane protein
MSLRKFLFWPHLVAGLLSGLVIAVMCFTGTVLAFEKEIVAWSERDARRVAPPTDGAPPLDVSELTARFTAARPHLVPTAITFSSDPRAAVTFATARAGAFFVDPYTGEVRQPQSRAVAGFMQTMLTWHRYLGQTAEKSRPVGKLVNGICNLAFFVLAVTGLYLWMPRQWSWSAVRPTIWFRQNAAGRARDFNWHNTIGFWTAPILIVLTLSAVPISFRWGGELLYTLTGTPLPASGPQSSGAPPPAAVVPAPPADSKPLAPDTWVAHAKQLLPAWQTLALRPLAGAGAPAVITVREHGSWPRTATTTLQYDPFTGKLLRRDGYAELSAARQIRAWTRFLHTGEAVGPIGQLVAGLATLGGLFLVYTGFALSWRRFFGPKPAAAPPAATP